MRRFVVLLAAGVVAVVAAGCAGGDEVSVTTTTATEPTTVTTVTTVTEGTTSPGVTTSTSPGASSDPDAVIPVGFDRVQATVTTADGETCELCLWLAATNDQRSLGLMRVTDLGPADGMAFVYPSARTGNFWMKNTLLPLSIAFFDASGTYLDAFDMEPCEADPCPMYPTAPDFLIAIETVQGDLDELGIGAGSVLDLSDLPCGP